MKRVAKHMTVVKEILNLVLWNEMSPPWALHAPKNENKNIVELT